MGDDAQLRTWVSEKLFSILGYSQPAVVTFIIEIAKKSDSPTNVVQKLIENGFSSSTETHVFAEEIYSKVPHQAASLNKMMDTAMGVLTTPDTGLPMFWPPLRVCPYKGIPVSTYVTWVRPKGGRTLPVPVRHRYEYTTRYGPGTR
ncbi:hypothetical protein EJ110_NYTH30650 [Nymphaea thermarum]|nr:hypothetical protein EJ110_NYTH30650 [Nymphaea thermarum]